MSTTAQMRRACEYLSISQNTIPDFKGKGKILVCGSGHTLWKDMENAGFVPAKWKQNFDIMAVNRAVMDIPSYVKYGYTNHMDMMLHWVRARDVAYTQKDRKHGEISLHSNREYSRTTVWPVPGSGTSGLNGVLVALLMGYEEIKVCGVPIDNGPHYYDAPWFQWNNFEGPNFATHVKEHGIIDAANKSGIIRPWLKMLQRFKDVVEPMSGNPRKIWLELNGVKVLEEDDLTLRYCI